MNKITSSHCRSVPRRIGKLLTVAASSFGLTACLPGGGAVRSEVFIEAIPTTSLTSSMPYSQPVDVRKNPIQLGFDDGPFYVSPASSLLYRGEHLGHLRDQGHLKPGSLIVEHRTVSWQGPLLTLPHLDEGRAYSASVWVRPIDTDQPAQVKLVWTRVVAGVLNTMVLAEITAQPRVWQKVEGEFFGPTYSATSVNVLSLDVAEADVRYLVDDFLVTYAELSAELQEAAFAVKRKGKNFIANGSVEEGIEPWTHQGGFISRSTAFAHTGSASLLIAGRTQEWNAPMMPVLGLENNKQYRFSIYARLVEGPPVHMQLTMKRTTAGQTTFAPLGTGIATSTGWSEISGTFKSSSISEADHVAVYLEALNPTVSYFVDTFTVEEVPE